MSALAGVFGPAAGSAGTALPTMLAAMRNRASGSAGPEHFAEPRAHLSAARHDWEATVSGWHGPLLIEADDWVIAADATLYYVADLRRRLGHSSASRPVDTASILLDAVRAWGPYFARYVEGDYAIIAWDRRRDRLFLARDFGGRRNLAYAPTHDGTIVVASSPTAVTLAPGVSSEYDSVFLATSAAGIVGHGNRTAFRQVGVVPGGCTLLFEGGRISEVDRWIPPTFNSGWESGTSETAAEELRALLERATSERLSATGTTTVWMSGGWDSTSVFASGCASLGGFRAQGRALLPISMTYPADDTGNEDAHINAVAGRWNAPVRWVDTEQIALMADSDRRVALRDDPMAQAFESQVRRLSQVTRELECHVALDGFGGDHLFHVSSGAIIADHLFYGRWLLLRDAWRQWPGAGREFARLCLLPHLSPGVRAWLGLMRGRPIAGYWDRTFPNWIVSTPGLRAELSPEFERQPGEGASEYESRKAVGAPFVQRAISWNHALGLDEGVQIRAPLFDTRVISFAAGRPLSDRGGGGDSKRLLRAAMRGLIPESVLAPRGRKTGTPVGYFRRQLQAFLPSEMARFFGSGESHLARHGVLDQPAMKAAGDQYLSSGEHALGALLHLTLEAERWLAARARRG